MIIHHIFKDVCAELSTNSILISGKESFINAKKVLNFTRTLTNEKKVIKSLAFHIGIDFPLSLPNI